MDNKIAKIIKKHYPEIENGWHVPVWVRIESINETPNDGDLSDQFRAYYCASVKILSKDGQDTNSPMLDNIALSGSFSPSGGMLQLPQPGMLATIAFAFGHPDKPYIDKILPYGVSLPKVTIGETTIQSRHGVKIHLQQDGSIAQITDNAIIEKSNKKHVESGAEIEQLQSLISSISENSSNEIGGIYQLAAYGAMYLLTTGNAELSALNDLSLTSGNNLNEHIFGQRISEIKKRLKITITDSAAMTLDKDGFDVRTTNGKIFIGQDNVDIVKSLYDLTDIVSQLANTLSSHTHPAPKGPTGVPNESGIISGQSAQSAAINEMLVNIVKK
ncbi:hypothetical protein [Photobacterium damselae]|uniref:hypothetical protein n=1 Tax=Photobacterium damselae TaxID=38293 RepID=UPI002F3ECEE7